MVSSADALLTEEPDFKTHLLFVVCGDVGGVEAIHLYPETRCVEMHCLPGVGYDDRYVAAEVRKDDVSALLPGPLTAKALSALVPTLHLPGAPPCVLQRVLHVPPDHVPSNYHCPYG